LIGELLKRGDSSVFVEMFSALSVGVAVRDPTGAIVYANSASLKQLGVSSLAELPGGPFEELDALVFEDGLGNPVPHEDLPGPTMLRGETAEPMIVRVGDPISGEVQWWQITGSVLRDPEGALLGVMTVTEDVSAIRTADLRTRALAESGRILASSLDYGQTLRNVAEVAVLLTDYCSVDLVGERGSLRRVAAAHRDPRRRGLVDRLGSLAPVALQPDHPVSRVLRTNIPELFDPLDDTDIAAVARDPEHLKLLRSLGVRSMLIVPLRVPSRTMGVMTMATDVSRRRLTEDDVALAEQLGRRAAVAVENSRLHTKLRGIAETLQTGLLPAELPTIPGWEIASLYRPAATEFRVDVGGDFYEIFEQDGAWFVIMGDVTGKGVTAASVTALMRHGARVAGRTEPDPVAILQRLDEALAEQPKRAMATAVCMHIRDDVIRISSAGHPPAVIVSPDGRLRELPSPDAMLGAFNGIERHEQTLTATAGDLIVVYTDGVPDAPNAYERFGVDRLMRLLSSVAGATPQEALDQLDAELKGFGADSGGDDVAVIALRRAVS
jgi:serine phosphatase RsbU (regulator of sigma subunit)